MIPVGTLVGALFCFGILSKNSELTALRSSGMTLFAISKPIFACGILISLATIVLNETLVPYCNVRVKEIYNIDINQKDQAGTYSQKDFWWRDKNIFYSSRFFDSRTNSLSELSQFEISPSFSVTKRTDAKTARYLDSLIGWSMREVVEYEFTNDTLSSAHARPVSPLPLIKTPKDFYDVKTDPQTMSFRELKRFIKERERLGSNGNAYLPYLYEKLSFPFISFIIIPAMIPFSIRSARSGSLASSCLAALVIAFLYYAIHSLSLALGRAEMWPPLLAAWMANIILGIVGTLLFMGAESPD